MIYPFCHLLNTSTSVILYFWKMLLFCLMSNMYDACIRLFFFSVSSFVCGDHKLVVIVAINVVSFPFLERQNGKTFRFLQSYKLYSLHAVFVYRSVLHLMGSVSALTVRSNAFSGGWVVKQAAIASIDWLHASLFSPWRWTNWTWPEYRGQVNFWRSTRRSPVKGHSDLRRAPQF